MNQASPASGLGFRPPRSWSRPPAPPVPVKRKPLDDPFLARLKKWPDWARFLLTRPKHALRPHYHFDLLPMELMGKVLAYYGVVEEAGKKNKTK